jgi:hypothetical protein
VYREYEVCFGFSGWRRCENDDRGRKRSYRSSDVKIMSLRKQLIVIRGCTGSNWRHNSDDIDDG